MIQAGNRVLIVGAGGGIGTALCELGKLAGLVMYGVDSAAKHHALARYGVIPIDLQTDDLAAAVRWAEQDGLDAVFDGVGGTTWTRLCPFYGLGASSWSTPTP